MSTGQGESPTSGPPPGPAEAAVGAAVGSLEARIAVVERRVVDDHEELLRIRQRVHGFESISATVQLITQDMRGLHEELDRTRADFGSMRTDLYADMQEIAKQSARDAIDVAFERFDQNLRERGVAQRGWIAIGLQLGAVCVALASACVALWLGLR